MNEQPERGHSANFLGGDAAALPISVVIPAFNEADRISLTIAAARALPGVKEVIVVDDGSYDHTADVARAENVDVVRLATNAGKARALEAGVERATGELLLFLDADLCDTADFATVLIAPVIAGDADMTIATFPVVPGRGGGRGVVVRLARYGIKRLTGRTMAAPLSGQRCLMRAAFLAASPLARGFGVEVALTIDVLRSGMRVVEIETRMDHRVTQNDWKAQWHRVRQLRDVALALLPRFLSRAMTAGERVL